MVAQNPDDQLFAADVYRDVVGPLNLSSGEDEVRQRVAEALGVLSIERIWRSGRSTNCPTASASASRSPAHWRCSRA